MRVLVVTAVLLLVGGPYAGAQGDAPVEIADAGTVVVLSGEPVPVRLLNTTGGPLRVGVAASARAADRSEAAVEVRQGDAVVTSVDIGPGGDVWLSLDLVGEAPPKAISGYFVATAGAVAVRRPITAEPAAKAAIDPEVASWETEWAPLWPWSAPEPLPGRVPAATCPANAEPVSATVVSGHDTALVTARCTDSGLVLDLTGVPSGWPSRGTGEYEGQVDFGEKTLDVTVEHSSSALAALGWLLAGIAAAVAGASYGADRRPFSARKTAIADIPVPSGSLEGRVAKAKAQLRRTLQDTRPGPVRGLLPWPDGANAERLAAIDKDTARLRDAAALTADHDRGLAVLSERSAALHARFPGMAERFAELADPPADLTAKGLADLVADAAAVPGLAALVDRLEPMRATVADPMPRSRERHAARARLNQLFGAIARLERPVDVAGLRADVEETAALVDRLVPVGDLPQEGGIGPRGFAPPEGAVEIVRRVVDGLGDVLGGTGRTAMVVRDAAAAVVVAVVALWTGFAALYLASDTWGTLWDVLTAVTWGAAATAVSGPLLAAMRRIGSSRQPGD